MNVISGLSTYEIKIFVFVKNYNNFIMNTSFLAFIFVRIIVMEPVEATIKCTCHELEPIARVDIDSEGDFKYVLVKVHADRKGVKLPACMPSIAVVRGYKRCNNHTEIFNEVGNPR